MSTTMIKVERLDDVVIPRTKRKRKKPKLVGTILLSRRDVAFRIDGLGKDGVRGRVAGTPRDLGATFRMRFDLPGHEEPAFLMARLVTAKVVGVNTQLTLAYQAAWSTDEGSLQVFLLDYLRLKQVAAQAVTHRPHAWFYRFEEAQEVEEAGPENSRRREPRIALRRRLAWVSESQAPTDGVAYNVSRRGIFVQCTTPPPAQGTEVRVMCPLKGAVKDRVTLVGIVCWSGEGMDGTNGFGLELTEVDDGGDGKFWNEWIHEEAQFSGQG